MVPVAQCEQRQCPAAAASGLRCAMLAAIGVALSGHAAFADEADTAPLVVALANVPGGPGLNAERNGPQLEISTTSLPRFDNADNGNRTSRLDMTWMAPRRSALGLSLGMTSPDTSTALVAGNRVGLAPSVDLGLRWRYTLDSNYRVDVTAWRRIVPPDALSLVQAQEASYGARVEMALGAGVPKSGFVADHGFLGVQLDNGARVTLRRSGGHPMVYYRNKF
jgi:hypothetical protein